MTPLSILLCLLTVTTAYSTAIALYPLLHRGGRSSILAQWLALAASVGTLLWIPRDEIILRALVALPLTDLMFRVFDFSRQCRTGAAAHCTWSRYCAFLVPFPVFLVIFGAKDRRLGQRVSWTREVTRVVLGAVLFGLGWPFLLLAQHSPLLRSSFVLDHVVKLTVFAIVVEAASQCAWGVERLLGYDAPLPINHTYRSRTPAEFWTRWNQRVYAWLYLNVFLASGGNRAPVRGVVMTFLISALLHEAMFDIALSRIDGYQAVFFLIQIPAVLASRPLERMARRGSPVGAILAHSATILWIGASSVFFFHGVNRIFPFLYAAKSWPP